MRYNDNKVYMHHTESNKIRRSSQIIRYVYNKILDNQQIRRLLYYNTKTPLSQKGLGYDGAKVEQPDLDIEQLKEYVYDIPFNPEMDMESKCYIFIQLADHNFKIGNVLHLDVNVIVPADYYLISSGHRYYEISQEVANMFDGLVVTEEDYVDAVGNIEFELVEAPAIRLSKTNDMIWVNNRYKIQLVPFDRIGR